MMLHSFYIDPKKDNDEFFVNNIINLDKYYDIRVIEYLKNKNPQQLLSRTVRPNIIFPHLHLIRTICINIPRRFYNPDLDKLIESVVGVKLKFISQTSDNTPKCIKDLRLAINGKTYLNNIDLNIRIDSFNKQMLSKAHKLALNKDNKDIFNKK